MKVVTIYNNFARAKVDHDMLGRFDLPIYNTSADVVENFTTNFKGNAIFRYGFLEMLGSAFQDCVLQEFRFRDDQNYLLVFFANKIRFLSYDSLGNFGWVLSGGSTILEVSTPYTLDQCRGLQFTQNADVMVITTHDYEPKDLTRVAANSFTLTSHEFTDAGGSPFVAKSAAISGATRANPCVITATEHGLRGGDVVFISGVVGMTELNNKNYTITKIDDNSFSLDGIDSTSYTAYTSDGTAARSAGYPKCCLFYKARLYFANTPLKSTTVWGSGVGQYGQFDIPSSVTDTSPLQFTIADITQPIDWLFGGDNSLIAGSADGLVAVNGGSVNTPIKADTIEASLTSADGANRSMPFKKDGFIFYIGKNNRNMYYFNYDLLSESFVAQDANFISYDITTGGMSKIRWKKDRDDLIYGIRGDNQLVSLNFKKSENIVGWHSQKTRGEVRDIGVITDNEGNPQLFALTYRNSRFYIEKLAEHVHFKERVDFFSYNKGQELETEAKRRDDIAHNRFVAEQMADCVYLDCASKVSNLQSNQITYNSGLGQISAASPVFASTDVGKDISYKTETGYESGRFKITAYIDAQTVSVDVLQEPTSNTYTDWYLSFSSISGLDIYEGQVVGVVADGGYLDDFTVSGAEIELPKQVLKAVIGYRYKGVIKSFSLGMQIKAENTQTTMKNISRVGMRFVASAGGMFGTSLYRTLPVQELKQGDINYLPPPVMDGTKFINYSDDAEIDKYFYIVQDEPLPLTVTAVMADVQMAIDR